MTLQLSQKEIDAWQQFVYDTTPGVEKPTAAAPVTINITLNIDNSINVQAAFTDGRIPVNMVDDRHRLNKYLPSMYQSGNMEATARALADGTYKTQKDW